MKQHRLHHFRSNAALRLPLLACAATLLALSANAQTPTPTSTAAGQPTVQTAAQPPIQPVRLNVFVSDESSNDLVADLRQEDFRVEEDGVPQTINYFAREELPVSYAIIVDNSGSTRSMLESLIRAGEALVSANKAVDETMIVRFIGSDQISVMQNFTDNQLALVRALEEMYVEGGQTAILDAVYLSATRVGERRRDETRRRAIVLFTDGEDRSSHYKQSEVQKLLYEHDVQVFAVGIVAHLDSSGGFTRKSAKDQAVKLLNSLTQETGGRAFYPKNLRELQAAVNSITRELRTQYVIGYQPSNNTRDGKFRKVQVKLNETAAAAAGGGKKRTVRLRAGYIAPGAKEMGQPVSKDKSPRFKTQ